MSYKLFLDDERPCPDGWVLARDFWSFKRIINDMGIPSEVSLDYYLGDKYTGLDCAEYLMVKFQDDGKAPFPKVTSHSSSKNGRLIIEDFLKEFTE